MSGQRYFSQDCKYFQYEILVNARVQNERFREEIFEIENSRNFSARDREFFENLNLFRII